MNWKPSWACKERYLLLDDFDGEQWRNLTQWKGRTLKSYYQRQDTGRSSSHQRG